MNTRKIETANQFAFAALWQDKMFVGGHCIVKYYHYYCIVSTLCILSILE